MHRAMECWAGSIAAVTAWILWGMCRRVHIAQLTKAAGRFHDRAWVADYGAKFIVDNYFAKYAGEPNNAIKAWIYFGNRFMVTSDKNLFHFAAWGKDPPPAGAVVIGGLTLLFPEREVGHWVATLRLKGDAYVRVDDTHVLDVTDPHVDYWVWLRPVAAEQLGGARAKLNAAPTRQQLAALNKKAKATPPKANSTTAATKGSDRTAVTKPTARKPAAKRSPAGEAKLRQAATPAPAKTGTVVPLPAATPDRVAVRTDTPTPPPTAPPITEKAGAVAPATKKAGASGAKRREPEAVQQRRATTFVDGRGAPRKLKTHGFAGAFSAAAVRADVRDATIVSAVLLLRALAQALSPDLARPARPAGSDVTASLAWQALFDTTESTLTEIRAQAPKRSVLGVEQVLRALMPGLHALGLERTMVDAVVPGATLPLLPLSNPLPSDTRSHVLVSSPCQLPVNFRISSSTMKLGCGAKGTIEAAIISGAPTDAGTPHHVTIVRQRATTGGPTANDGFVLLDDGISSQAMTLQNALRNMGPGSFLSVVLVRVAKTGVLPSASTEQAQASMPTSMQIIANADPSIDKQRDSRRTADDAVAHFRLRQGDLPALVQLTGDFFTLLKIHDTQTHAQLTMLGKSRAVRHRQQNELKRLQRELEPELHSLPLGEALVVHYQRRQRTGAKGNTPWGWASMHREMCNLHGALGDAPIYTDYPDRVRLGESMAWRAAMRFVRQQMQEHQPENQVAATFNQVDLAVHRCVDKQVSAAIMLAWMSAGRLGDITQMKRREVEFDETKPGSQMYRVTFRVRRGKGVAMSQPYTVNTLCPPRWRDMLIDYLNTFKTETDRLFCRGNSKQERELSLAITRALRAADPTLTQRAMRRGALQTLAADPSVTSETIMSFSGHRSVDMLKRYLDWGRLFSNGRDRAVAAAANLFRQGPQEKAKGRRKRERKATFTDDETTSSSDSSDQMDL